jgi:DNA-binding transcriptional LysR family regulator
MQVRLHATDRRVDVIGEGFDIAIRVRSKLDTDATLVVRTFGQSKVLLVASPDMLNRYGRPKEPTDISQLPALSNQEHEGAQGWELLDAQGEKIVVDIQPRLICGDFNALLQSCKSGVGVTLLPEFVCGPAIERGELEVVLPEWSVPQGTMHFVYPSRRGLLPGVRAFVDFLAERLPDSVRENHAQCRKYV